MSTYDPKRVRSSDQIPLSRIRDNLALSEEECIGWWLTLQRTRGAKAERAFDLPESLQALGHITRQLAELEAAYGTDRVYRWLKAAVDKAKLEEKS